MHDELKYALPVLLGNHANVFVSCLMFCSTNVCVILYTCVFTLYGHNGNIRRKDTFEMITDVQINNSESGRLSFLSSVDLSCR